MNLDSYFQGLEKKFGRSETLAKFKSTYFDYLKDLPTSGRNSLLRKIKTQVKAEYEIMKIKEELYSPDIEKVTVEDELKSILEEFRSALNNIEKNLDKLKPKSKS